jgi:cell division protein ZapA
VSNDQTPISVNILDKEYRISCQPDERDALFESARYLDHKMREVRQTGRVIGAEKIAVMVALNIAHELLELKKYKLNDTQLLTSRIKNLQDKIEIALSTGTPTT